MCTRGVQRVAGVEGAWIKVDVRQVCDNVGYENLYFGNI